MKKVKIMPREIKLILFHSKNAKMAQSIKINKCHVALKQKQRQKSHNCINRYQEITFNKFQLPYIIKP